MIKSLLKMSYNRFASRYSYDAGYMSYVTELSISAGLRLSLLPLFSQFSGPKNAQEVWAGAMVGSTLDGDCGPCVQLVVDMALEAGVCADHLALCLMGRATCATDVGLGFIFAQAAIREEPQLESLRQQIEDRHGKSAVIAASFAASSGRIYPVLKRGLGFGQTCHKVSVGGDQITVSHRP